MPREQQFEPHGTLPLPQGPAPQAPAQRMPSALGALPQTPVAGQPPYPRLVDLEQPARPRASDAAAPPTISLVAPVFEEVGNLRALYRSVLETFGEDGDFELVLVDDGSRDGSPELIAELVAADARVSAVFFARNHGQSAAVTAGLRAARADVLATLDADLQNDPSDLPRMLERLVDENVDAVVGFREKRRDSWVRRASSRIANRVRNWISRDDIRDTGCSLKVFRAEAILSVPMFEGMHRFMPTLLRYHGYRVLEHPVGHHPRIAGKSKYGIRNRAWRAFKDLLAVRWMRARLIQPEIREVRRGIDLLDD